MTKKNYRHWGGVLLVAGTCIGAGMIGVPVKTAVASFYPTMLAFGITWLIMTMSALLLLEVSLFFPGETNFISMAKAILGNTGKNVAWFSCLMFMYCALSAYISGGVTIIIELLPVDFYMAIAMFIVPFMIIIYLGSKWVDLVNRFLTVGLIASFLLLCGMTMFGTSNALQPVANFTTKCDWKVLFFSLPILVATFGYHVIIPPLKSYLKEEISSLKKAIFIGGTIPLIVYVTWQVVVLLLIPVFGQDGLVDMLNSDKNPGDSIVNYLAVHTQHKGIVVLLITFLLCALTTSLIGVSWALFDFFADGFSILKNKKGKLILMGLTFIPPIIYCILFPQGFLKAVGLVGIFSAIIMIIYPGIMALRLRSKGTLPQNPTGNVKYRTSINKQVIWLIVAFGLLTIVLECINNF